MTRGDVPSSEIIRTMKDFSFVANAASSGAPWWVVSAATLAGVLITVAATVTLEMLRARRDRDARLFDERRQAYAAIADLVRRQVVILNDGQAAFIKGVQVKLSDETRAIHREAALLASLIGSPELVDAIDYQYQCTLEAWAAMRKSLRKEDSPEEGQGPWGAHILVSTARKEALRVINVLRRDTGVPGELKHQWF
jgi:hypothetical protein